MSTPRRKPKASPKRDGHAAQGRTDQRAIDSIRVGQRHRRDFGDVEALAADMARIGLLQPIVVTPEGLLLCGERRLHAAKLLGWKTIPVTIRRSTQ